MMGLFGQMGYELSAIPDGFPINLDIQFDVGQKTFLITIVDGPAPIVAVTGVSLDQETLTLTAGGAAGTLLATVAPADATNKNVSWTSSDESVATVADGVVTPVAAGSATITVITADGSFIDTCEVTVEAAPTPVTVENVTAESRTSLVNWYRFDVIGDYSEVLIKTESGTDLGPAMSKAAFETAGYYQGGVAPDDIIVIYVDGVEIFRGIPEAYSTVTVENVTAESRTSLVNWYRFNVIGDYSEVLIKTDSGTDLGPAISKADFETTGYYQGGVAPNDIIVIYVDGVEKFRGVPGTYSTVTVENVTAESRTSLVNWYRFNVIGDYSEVLIKTESGTDLGPAMSKAAFETAGYYQGGVAPDDIIVIYVDGVEKFRGVPGTYSTVTVENVTAESRTSLVNWYRFNVIGDYVQVLIKTDSGTDLGPAMSKADFETTGYYQGGVAPNDIIVIYVDGVEKFRGVPGTYSTVTVENVTAESRTSLVNWYRFDVIGDYSEVVIRTESCTDLGPVMSKADFETAGYYQGGVAPNDIIVIYVDGVEKYRGTPGTYSIVTVTGVSIKTPPAKVTYFTGDALDLIGLVVTLTKSNGTTEDVALADFAAMGIMTSPANGAALTTSNTAVTITVNGKTATQLITVNTVTVTGVSIKIPPAKVTYYAGDALDLSGLVVTLTKSNSTTEDVALANFAAKSITTSPTNGAALNISNAAVTISVNGKTTTQPITVNAVTVTGVSVKTPPSKVTYYAGDALDLSGLVVTLTKSNSTTEDVALANFAAKGITTSPTNGAALNTSNTAVTISVNGKTTTQPITVNAVTVTGVSVKTAPTKVTYNDGEALNLSGLVVTLTKSNATTEDVALANFAAKGITTLPVNGATLKTSNKTIMIMVNGKTAIQTITVNATVTGVSIKTAPTKVTYNDGEALNLSGLVVTLTKSNATTEDVAFADFAAKGITTSPTNGAALNTSNTGVTITVNGKTTTQPITVNAITITGVSIKTPPAKVTYFAGNALNLSGLVVTLTKSNATTEDVALDGFAAKGITTSPANGATLTTSNTSVTITVNGKTATQPITVNAITVTGVSIKTAPTKVTYYNGDALNLSGLVVTLSKSNGTTEDVALANFVAKGITTDPANGSALSTAITEVVITANGKTTTQSITVHPVTVANVRADRSSSTYNYFYFNIYGDYQEVYITDSAGTKYGGTFTKAEFEAQGFIRTVKMMNSTIRIYVDGVEKFRGVPEAYSGTTDKAALNTAITAANSNKSTAIVSLDGSDVDSDDYWVTEAVMNAYINAIAAAQAVVDDAGASQTEIDAAVTNLQTATTTFNNAKSAGTNPVDKTALDTAITAANNNKTSVTVSADGSDVLAENYWVTEAVMNAYTNAIAAAQAVADNADATQAQVDTAVINLQTATTTFNNAKAAGTQPVDKSVLETAITAANNNKTTATISTDGADVFADAYWVTATVMNAYTNAIAAAQAVVDNSDATQAQVDAAVINLQTATTTFNNAKAIGKIVVANVRADKSSSTYNYFYFDVYGDYEEVYITDSAGTKYGGTFTKAEFEAQGYIRTVKMVSTTIRIYVDGVKKFDGVPTAI